MRGYSRGVWVDDPITDTQRGIVTALGFEAPEAWAPEPWSCGAFSPTRAVVVRHLPYLPEVNTALEAVGFRWDDGRREWHGEDRTPAQVEVLQALHYCAGRYYPAVDLYAAIFGHPETEWGRRKAAAMRAAPPWAVECGTGAICPVWVGPPDA